MFSQEKQKGKDQWVRGEVQELVDNVRSHHAYLIADFSQAVTAEGKKKVGYSKPLFTIKFNVKKR